MVGREQMVQNLGEQFAGKSFCIHEQTWWHHTREDQGYVTVEYTLSVLPGLDGKRCSQFTGDDPVVCVARFREAVRAAELELMAGRPGI